MYFVHVGPDEDTLGPEGMEKFCEDIGVEPENVSYFQIGLLVCRFLFIQTFQADF